jgi:gluconokinase
MAQPPVPPEPGARGRPGPDRRLVVVMGVSGVGKTAVGRELARRLGVEYADADDLHPPANVEKMRSGTPLTDEDRLPWLRRVGQWLGEREQAGGVASCSALRRAYREVVLEGAPTAYFLHLTADEEVLRERMSRREHFMPPSLLASQLQTLEPLGPDEPGVEVDASQPVRAVVDEFLARTGGDA